MTKWKYTWTDRDRARFDAVFARLPSLSRTARRLSEVGGRYISVTSAANHKSQRRVPFEWAQVYSQVLEDPSVIGEVLPR
jgi:hypothetical protein